MKKKAILKDLWIIVFDLIAVNLSYYLALLIRFFVNGQFRPTVSYYQTDFLRFAPFYTVIAIAVFFIFRLYGGMWMYAGLNDMNRIIGANAVTAAVHVIGTLVFIRRMPISYYLIGAVLQFFFVVCIRFGYRILLAEKKKLKKEETIPAIIVGSGDLGRKVLKHLEENTPYRPVSIIGQSSGQTLDGVPVIGQDQLGKIIQEKGIRRIFIADRDLSQADRETIRATGIEVQDFTGALSNLTGEVPVTGLMETISSPVTVVIDGKPRTYSNGTEALSDLHTKYLVTSIRGEKIEIDLKPDDGMAYVRQHEEETGEELSFF